MKVWEISTKENEANRNQSLKKTGKRLRLGAPDLTFKADISTMVVEEHSSFLVLRV